MHDEAMPTGTDPVESHPLGLDVADGRGPRGPRAAVPALPVAAAIPLDDAATARLLSRLPAPGPASATPDHDVLIRDASAPRPRPGRTVAEAFPPAGDGPALPGPAEQAPGDLEVLRYQPEGAVTIAPGVSVTFSSPMVALAEVAAAVVADLPVRLMPQPAGEWRWADPRTLVFVPAGERLPMATRYTVEVPAGVRSAAGGVLAETVSWSFETPAPALVATHPNGAQVRPDTLVALVFNQAVAPADVLAAIALRRGHHDVALRLAEPAEAAADPEVTRLLGGVPQGRAVVLRPVAPLALDESHTVTVGPGLASAEGPVATTEPRGWQFQTYGPFRVVRLRPWWRRERPAPGETWSIDLTNPIDATQLTDAHVRLEPPARHRVSAWGTTLAVAVAATARTRYRIHLDPDLRDVYGQALGPSDAITVDVGDPNPALALIGGEHIILDPAGEPRVSLRTIGLDRVRLEVYDVSPGDWAAWREYAHSFRYGSQPEQKDAPGERVGNVVLDVPGEGLAPADLDIDLSSWLDGGFGQLVVVASPVGRMDARERQSLRAAAWIQATRLGVDAVTDATEMRAWVTDLATGAPVAGARCILGTAQGVTGEDGTCALQLPETSSPTLLVLNGADRAVLPQGSWWGRGWSARRRAPESVWVVFDDRGLYRPGEQVRVKGWLRSVTRGPSGDVGAPAVPLAPVRWIAEDASDNEIAKGEVALDALGGFDLAITLPATPALGTATLRLEPAGGAGTSHEFRIAEFRRPEYEVGVTLEGDAPVAGDELPAEVTATYYAGGPLRAADVAWTVSAEAARYTPPGWDRFSFGTGAPWWRFGGWGDAVAEPSAVHLSAATGDAGSHAIRILTTPSEPPRPWTITAEATVQDVNRQAWTASATSVVHPSSLCVGLRLGRSFVEANRPLELDVVVTDLVGAAVPGVAIGVRAERREQRQVAGEWRDVTVETRAIRETSGAVPLALRLDALEGGRWTVTAEVADTAGRRHRSRVEAWVAGAGGAASRGAEAGELQLVPDRESYAPGDTAELLLLAPFAPAEGLLLVERDGIVRTERFSLESSMHTLAVPLEDPLTPGAHVHVLLAGAEARADGPVGVTRPAYAEATVRLPVTPVQRTLGVMVTPRHARLRPGETTTLDLQVLAADGAPVPGAGATLFVVDESVLALAGFAVPDPIAELYRDRGTGADTARSRPSVVLAKPDDLTGVPEPEVDGYPELAPVARRFMAAEGLPPPMPMMAAPMAGAMPPGGGAPTPPPIRARTDFSALALFVASVAVDATGRAAVDVTLPDNLTRYRIVAVVTDGARRFGVGESALTARLPLMVRPSAPRFLNAGDRFELPVVIQNQADEALEVEVAVRPANITLTHGAGRRLLVPSNDRVEVRFPAETARAGEARLEVAAASGPDADAATVTLPVWTPATAEAFAIHGTLDDGTVSQPVRMPAGAIPAFGGLDVTTSSTGVAALADAVLYLAAYPYECSEQLASRLAGIAALRDVLAAFEAPDAPTAAELEATVARDVARLAARQGRDGGFGWWRRDEESWPYLTAHVANALGRARAKGFAIPDALRNGLLDYLRTVDRRFSHGYRTQARTAIGAYALHARASLGDEDPARALAFVRRRGADSLGAEAIGWLLPVLRGAQGGAAFADELRRRLANAVVETPGAASITVRYEDGAHLLLASDRRADAIVLDALIADQPRSDLIPKLVAGLLAHRTAGRWGNTQENVFVLLALGRYFDTYEAVTPDFVARLWLGDRHAGEQPFRGRSTDRRALAIPMAAVAEATTGGANPADLVIEKDGPGRLYYRLGLRYAPAGLQLDPLDRGFEVRRTYRPVDDPADVRQDADGTWRIRAGARVRVELAMVNRSRRYHVALVDPLPAGFEPVDPDLPTSAADTATAGTATTAIGAPGLGGPGRRGGHWWWWTRAWYDHQDLRDDRVEAFTTLLWEGEHAYAYTARATTLGEFTAPPTRAEEMYAPETFGRGGTDRVVVE